MRRGTRTTSAPKRRPRGIAVAAIVSALLSIAAFMTTSLSTATVPTSSAQAAVSCGSFVPITINGGAASARECRSGTLIRVDGHIKDTGVAGKCAWLRVSYNQQATIDRIRACATGTDHWFTFPWRTSTDAYEQLYLAGP